LPPRIRKNFRAQSFQTETIGALIFWWSMIFSENRAPLFRIMLADVTNRTNPYPTAFSTGCRAGPGQTRPNITLARRQCHPTNAEALRRS
jgi:hypothetical protein